MASLEVMMTIEPTGEDHQAEHAVDHGRHTRQVADVHHHGPVVPLARVGVLLEVDRRCDTQWDRQHEHTEPDEERAVEAGPDADRVGVGPDRGGEERGAPLTEERERTGDDTAEEREEHEHRDHQRQQHQRLDDETPRVAIAAGECLTDIGAHAGQGGG
jgi:hypothetical protein